MQVCSDLSEVISLRRFLPTADFLGADDVHFQGCCCDSRQVRAGDVFAAWAGSRQDGRTFVDEAIARGCAAILAEAPIEASVPVCVVPDVRRAYGEICQALAGNPSRHLKVIGITGTNGKTTTSCLVAGILAAAGHRVGLLGTLGYLDGRVVEDATHTTPPPESLAPLLARMVRNQCSHAIMEVSSHALDQSRIAGMKFDAACVTNVTHDHLDYHRTLSEYRRTKAKLFDHLADDGFVVLNADDPGSASYLRRLNCPVLTVGIDLEAEISAVPMEQYVSEQTFLLTAGSESVPVRTQMIGLHHIYNCLHATAIGLAYGIELTTIARGLESVGHVPGRLERIECGQSFGVFVDYAHTPDALSLVLLTLKRVVSGRVICVFGAGGERDMEKRALMGSAVDQDADIAILTNDNPRGENPAAIFNDILKGFDKAEIARVIPDRTKAIHHALSMARPGDCVLIAGKGHETCQIIGRQRLPHDDRKIAREWLYERAELLALKERAKLEN